MNLQNQQSIRYSRETYGLSPKLRNSHNGIDAGLAML